MNTAIIAKTIRLILFGTLGVWLMVTPQDRSGVVEIERNTQAQAIEVQQWKTAETAKALNSIENRLSVKCTDANHPFLTDIVVVSNDLPNLDVVTLDTALSLDKRVYTVVAYCK